MPNKRILIGLLCAVCAGPLPAMAAAVPLDTVRVVVNDDIITRLELAQRMRAVVQQLQRQGTRLPESGILEKQMLERMIQEKLLLQFAKENGVRVDGRSWKAPCNASRNGTIFLRWRRSAKNWKRTALTIPASARKFAARC